MPFRTHRLARTVSAQQSAAALHVSGYRVAKGVLVEADGRPWVALLRAPERVDPVLLATVLHAQAVRRLAEPALAPLFPDCEPGVVPPFGSLYGLPVALDSGLLEQGRLLFHAGSHDELMELYTADLVALEHPRVGRFGLAPLEAIPRGTVYEEAAGPTGG